MAGIFLRDVALAFLAIACIFWYSAGGWCWMHLRKLDLNRNQK